MWLKLGEKEIVNLEHVASIRKGENSTIEIIFSNMDSKRLLPFRDEASRDSALSVIMGNLHKLGQSIQ
jgi:hypothetical protein